MSRLRCVDAPSTARSFIQIASRSYLTQASPSAAPFDFLLPRETLRIATSAAIDAPAPRIRPQFVATNTRARLSWQRRPQSMSRRQFSSSPIQFQTRAILNSQKDEDGNEMLLEITPRAAKRLSQIMQKDNNPDLALRIQVESGGCHGFQYLMSLVTLPPKDALDSSSIVSEDDTVFQYIADDADAPTSSDQGPKIILDEPSLDLLKGSKVDFTQELIGSQFKIVDNPLATSSCGCGTSFDIKM